MSPFFFLGLYFRTCTVLRGRVGINNNRVCVFVRARCGEEANGGVFLGLESGEVVENKKERDERNGLSHRILECRPRKGWDKESSLFPLKPGLWSLTFWLAFFSIAHILATILVASS